MQIQSALLFELVRKNLKVRYQSPAMGFVWALLIPGLLIAVFYTVFSLFLRVRIEEAPFLLYLASALFPWRFFHDSLTASASCLVDNKNLVREARLAHYLIPVSVVITEFILLVPSILITVAASGLLLGGLPGLIVVLPAVMFLHLAMTAGLAVVCAIAYVHYRDTRHIIEVLMQLLFYATPVFYSLSLVKTLCAPVAYAFYIANPLVGFVMLYRYVLLKGFSVPAIGIREACLIMGIPVMITVLVVAFAAWLYANNSRTINDRLSY